MVEILLDAGVAVTVLVATGLHRVGDATEEAALIGDPWVAERVTVAWHVATDDASHTDLGMTPHGTPVSVDSRFVDADLRIVLGLVEPHFMAGWSGGRKVIAPGVAGHRTIRRFHSAAFMADPAARPCTTIDNPLHREQLAIVAMIGETYSVDVVLDEERRLVHVSFGDILASHQAAVTVAERSCMVGVGRQFSTVVTTGAGHPLDLTYYQAIKGIVCALGILREGGTLIVAAECAEGLGSDHFRTAQRRLVRQGSERFVEAILDKPLADIDEWQTQELTKALSRGRVVLYSSLSEADRSDTAVECVDALTLAIAGAVQRSGDADIAVIPEGPYVIPHVLDADGPTEPNVMGGADPSVSDTSTSGGQGHGASGMS
jgi:nickel-dependent lactate racemase